MRKYADELLKETNTERRSAQARCLAMTVNKCEKIVDKTISSLLKESRGTSTYYYDLEDLNFSLPRGVEKIRKKLEAFVDRASYFTHKAAEAFARAGYPDSRDAQNALEDYKREISSELDALR